MKRTAMFLSCCGLALLLLACPAAFAQDAMRYGVRHLSVLAENEQVRVLRYAPHKGDRTPMHSHPASVVYVLKGGRVKYNMPDGSSKISEFETGQTLLRTPVTHADEALDDVEMIMTELKPQAGPHG
jgi:hypothetical protein